MHLLYKNWATKVGYVISLFCQWISNNLLVKQMRYIHRTGKARKPLGSCQVEFDTFIPVDLERYPIAIFWSRCTHNNPSASPLEAATWVDTADLLLLIWLQTPDLTLTKCKSDFTSKVLLFISKRYIMTEHWASCVCQKYCKYTLAGLHQSFANVERFSDIIAKKRALEYPCGRHLYGLHRKARTWSRLQSK
jgi:hypothetical protein